MLPDRVSNPGPLTYESGVLPIALRGPALCLVVKELMNSDHNDASYGCEVRGQVNPVFRVKGLKVL